METGQARIKLESEIATRIFKDNQCTAHFAYSDEGVSIVTHNPAHDTSFLVGNFTTLAEAKEYVTRATTRDELTYTVTWHRVGDGTLHKSYFSGRSLKDIVDKFYYDKHPLTFIVRSIVLNPSS